MFNIPHQTINILAPFGLECNPLLFADFLHAAKRKNESFACARDYICTQKKKHAGDARIALCGHNRPPAN